MNIKTVNIRDSLSKPQTIQPSDDNRPSDDNDDENSASGTDTDKDSSGGSLIDNDNDNNDIDNDNDDIDNDNDDLSDNDSSIYGGSSSNQSNDSSSTIAKLSQDPLFFVLTKFFMTDDENIATVLNKLVMNNKEELREINSSLKKINQTLIEITKHVSKK